MEFHAVATLFPMLGEEEFNALVADIKANGQIEPVWTYQGKIIDGRNRYKACETLGIEPHLREWTGEEANLLQFVLSLNLHRRHLSSSQKAILAVEIEKHLAVAAEQRMLAGKKSDPVQKIAQGKASEQAAQIVGTNRQYVLDAKRITEKAPEVADAVRRGVLSIPDALAVTRLPAEQRQSVLEKMPVQAGMQHKSDEAYWAIRGAKREAFALKRAQEDAERKKAQAPGTEEWFAQIQREKDRLLEMEEWRERWKAREAEHVSRVKEQLNSPEKSGIRADLYATAKEADVWLSRGLQAYLSLLLHFNTLIEGVPIEEDTYNETPLEGRESAPHEWGEFMHQMLNRSRWFKEFVAQEYEGSPEALFRHVHGNKRLYRATAVPFINFVELGRWVEDPLNQQEEEE